jgi:hypothetical protein
LLRRYSRRDREAAPEAQGRIAAAALTACACARRKGKTRGSRSTGRVIECGSLSRGVPVHEAVLIDRLAGSPGSLGGRLEMGGSTLALRRSDRGAWIFGVRMLAERPSKVLHAPDPVAEVSHDCMGRQPHRLGVAFKPSHHCRRFRA